MGQGITIKQMASELGLSMQSVSLALRGQRGVSEATRERIKAHAAAMGYKPDAGLRALADYRTEKRQAASRWNQVAMVNDWPTADALRADEFYGQFCTALDEAAGERGIHIEQAWLGHRSGNMKAVLRQLRHRGITALLLAPPPLEPEPDMMVIPRERFQMVSFGPQHYYPGLHTVTFDFFENLRLAWSVLWGRGCRRIGLVYEASQDWRTSEGWRGAYYVEKRLAGISSEDLAPLRLLPGGKDRPREFQRWAREQRVDGIISSVYALQDWAEALDPVPQLGLFNVCEPWQSGIDLNIRHLARSAIELLLLEMRQSLLVGPEQLPFRVVIPGRWVDATEAVSNSVPH